MPAGLAAWRGALAAPASTAIRDERPHVTQASRPYQKAIAVALAVLVALASCLSFAASASADDVADARTVLEQAQAKLDEIEGECEELNATVERLQAQIDETAQSAFSMQEVLAAGRESLGQIASYEYRNNTFSTMLDVFLGSASLQEFTRNMDYLNLLAQSQTAELQVQAERKSQYDSSIALLGAQIDAQEAAKAQLEEKRAEAEKVVDEATAKLHDAEEAQALQARAEAIAPSGGGSGSTGGSSGSGGSGGSGGGSASDGGSSAAPPSGWQSGGATAYNPTGKPTHRARPARGTRWAWRCACPCRTTGPTTAARSRYPTGAARCWRW